METIAHRAKFNLKDSIKAIKVTSQRLLRRKMTEPALRRVPRAMKHRQDRLAALTVGQHYG